MAVRIFSSTGLTAAVVMQPLHDFLHGGGHRNGSADRVRTVQDGVQILDVQVNLEARLVIAGDHHRPLGVEYSGTGEAAADRVKHELGIDAGLLRQRECLRHRADVAGDDDLVCELGRVARADVAATGHGGTHLLQHRLEPVKNLLLAADHKADRTVNGFGLAAGNGRVKHFNALLRQCRRDLLAGDGIDGAHVDERAAGLHMGSDAVFAEHDLPDLRAVGEHREHHVALLADLRVGRSLCAGLDQLGSGSVRAGYGQVITRLEQIHNASTARGNAFLALDCRAYPPDRLGTS